jgi:hypothetical protein
VVEEIMIAMFFACAGAVFAGIWSITRDLLIGTKK